MAALLAGGAIVLLTIAAYVPALQAGFIWDDDAYVTENPNLRTLDGLRRTWLEPASLPQYYPLVHTTFWLERRIWGLAPFGYHLVNILCHAAVAILVWRLLRDLAVPGAWLAASAFALHPVSVESVAWVTERKNVLSAFFLVAATIVLVRYLALDREPPGDRQAPPATAGAERSHPPRSTGAQAPTRTARGAWGSYALGVVLYLLALLSKTVSVVLPVILLLLIWWKRGRVRVREVLLLAPLAALGAMLASVTIWLEAHHVGAKGAEWHLAPMERVLLAGRAIWFYAGKIVWPEPLCFFYPRWELDARSPWQYLFPIGVLAGLLLLWLARGRTGRGPLAALLVYIAALGPALGAFDVFPMRYSYVADHFQYHASPALIALLVGCALVIFGGRVAAWSPGRRTAGWAAAGLLLAVLGALSWRQCLAYRDGETLWRRTLAVNPEAWAAENNLGLILARRGETGEAAEHYRRALALNPAFGEGRTNLGALLFRLGRTEEAAEQFREAARLRADDPLARLNLATALLKLDRSAEAIPHLEEALQVEPALLPALDRLAFALERVGRVDESAARRSEALALRAWILATHEDPRSRDGAAAVGFAEEAVRITGGDDARPLDALAAALAESGRFEEAASTARRAREAAEAAGDTVRAREIAARGARYAERRPYRDPAISKLAVAPPERSQSATAADTD